MKMVNRHFLFYSFGHGSSITIKIPKGAVILDCILEEINGAKSVSILTLEDNSKPKIDRTFKCYTYASYIPEFDNTNIRYWNIGVVKDTMNGSPYPVYYTIWEIN